MYGDNDQESRPAERRLDAPIALNALAAAELDCLEKAAAAAMPTSSRYRGWVAIPSDSGLTEEQEDFIDYWSPQRVLDDCHAKRRLLAWASNAKRANQLTASDESQLYGLLRALVFGRPDNHYCEG